MLLSHLSEEVAIIIFTKFSVIWCMVTRIQHSVNVEFTSKPSLYGNIFHRLGFDPNCNCRRDSEIIVYLSTYQTHNEQLSSVQTRLDWLAVKGHMTSQAQHIIIREEKLTQHRRNEQLVLLFPVKKI